ncbi:Dabb family protein [Hirschia litorea]|uniref:Dabb family protein n=1 Tax=Hirschia litorea TaxID=1199156 RepID=A0ABW2IMW3_9PROT
MKYLALALTLFAAACAQSPTQTASYSEQTNNMLTHNVFFDLKNKDEASVNALIDACYKYLAPHEGIVFFSAGPRVKEKQRDVNDLDFDVALNVIFKDVESHDAYQVSDIHMEFIKLYKDNWAKVRVFDGAASVANQPN